MADHARPDASSSLSYELFLAALALVSVGIGAYDFLHPREHGRFIWLDWVDLGIVAVFVVDFVREGRREGFAKHARANWWEIPSLIPITGAMIAQLEGYSVVRALRLVRVVRFLRVVRAVGVAARLKTVSGYLARIARRARIAKLAAFGVVVIALGSAAAHFAERGVEGSRLASYGEALWWATNMFSNVAYVDFQPATPLGRVIAGVLEFLGIAFIGVFAGSIANALLREPDPKDDAGSGQRAEDRGQRE